MDKNIAKRASVNARHFRVRKNVSGNAERPRLSVYRSEANIYAQIIDDEKGVTLAATSTNAKDLRASVKDLAPTEAAKAVGEAIAAIAIEKGIKAVVFDRGGRRYAGRVAALAEGARGKGLLF